MKKILVVDNDRPFLEGLEKVLSSRGYTVTPLEIARPAILHASRTLPDVILLNLQMEELDGYKIAVILRRLPETKNIPILAMTHSSSDLQDVRELTKLDGFIRCFEKPADLETIVGFIEEAVSGKGTE